LLQAITQLEQDLALLDTIAKSRKKNSTYSAEVCKASPSSGCAICHVCYRQTRREQRLSWQTMSRRSL
jgi:hypothetical protein